MIGSFESFLYVIMSLQNTELNYIQCHNKRFVEAAPSPECELLLSRILSNRWWWLARNLALPLLLSGSNPRENRFIFVYLNQSRRLSGMRLLTSGNFRI